MNEDPGVSEWRVAVIKGYGSYYSITNKNREINCGQN